MGIGGGRGEKKQCMTDFGAQSPGSARNFTRAPASRHLHNEDTVWTHTRTHVSIHSAGGRDHRERSLPARWRGPSFCVKPPNFCPSCQVRESNKACRDEDGEWIGVCTRGVVPTAVRVSILQCRGCWYHTSGESSGADRQVGSSPLPCVLITL